VKDSKVRIAYLKPGASFGKYTKVAILDCFVEFKKNWARDYNMDQIGLQGRVSNKDVEEIKRMADEFGKYSQGIDQAAMKWWMWQDRKCSCARHQPGADSRISCVQVAAAPGWSQPVK
jgi:hypothetical protein